MFFKKNEEKKPKKRKGLGCFGVVRLILSLVLLLVLGIGLFRAYQSSSTSFDPKSEVKAVLFSNQTVELLTGLLTVDLNTSFNRLKELLSKGSFQEPATQNPVNTIKSAEEFVPKSSLLYKFAIVSDSHNDNQNLLKALNEVKNEGVEFVVGLGDYTDVGTIDELVNTKTQFDTVKLNYYLTAGDHDLWDSRDKSSSALTNYSKVFGSPYSSFSHKETRFIIIFNSDNYSGLGDLQMKWLEEELKRATEEDKPKNIFVFMSTPLYHPSSDHVMGKVNVKLKSQADELIALFSKHKVTEIYAGDVHFYSRFSEPAAGLKMTVVGSLSSSRNSQPPRYALVDVYEDGSYNIQDREVK